MQLNQDNSSNSKEFIVTHDSTGYVTFTNANSGKVLDVSSGIAENRRNIQQYLSNGTKAQKWIVEKKENGYVIMSALNSDYVIDLSGGIISEGRNIQLYKSNDNKAQRWNFIYISKEDKLARQNKNALKDGTYTISSTLNNNFVLDIKSDSKADNGNVQLNLDNSSNSKEFIVTHDSMGYVTFTNANSGKVLDVSSGIVENRRNIQQYWALIGGKRFREYYSDILEKNSEQIDLSRCIREDDSAIIYIDEGDLYYHPEWQRQFMKSILDIVKLRKEECSLQLIITSNSPYILSDFFHQDVLYIMPNDEEFNIVETFGQNIHTLLKSPFFMKSTIGCVAYSKISGVMKALSYEGDSTLENKELPESIMEVLYNKRDDNLSKTELYNILKSFVNNIGEEIYKIELEHLLEESLPQQNEFDILLKQKAEIEERLRFLQESK